MGTGIDIDIDIIVFRVSHSTAKICENLRRPCENLWRVAVVFRDRFEFEFWLLTQGIWPLCPVPIWR